MTPTTYPNATVNVETLPLAVGAATGTKQDTTNTLLTQIDSKLATPMPVNGAFYQATQPVSIASMPSTPVTGTFWQTTQPVSPQAASTATISVTATITTASVLVIAANANRKGLLIYNNSANSVYLAYGSAANSSTNMTRILATFTQFSMEAPIYTGAIYGIRNSGTGTCLVTELT